MPRILADRLPRSALNPVNTSVPPLSGLSPVKWRLGPVWPIASSSRKTRRRVQPAGLCIAISPSAWAVVAGLCAPRWAASPWLSILLWLGHACAAPCAQPRIPAAISLTPFWCWVHRLMLTAIPTPEQLARVTEAVREYERGVAPRLLFTGGPAHNQFVRGGRDGQLCRGAGHSTVGHLCGNQGHRHHPECVLFGADHAVARMAFG